MRKWERLIWIGLLVVTITITTAWAMHHQLTVNDQDTLQMYNPTTDTLFFKRTDSFRFGVVDTIWPGTNNYTILEQP